MIGITLDRLVALSIVSAVILYAIELIFRYAI